MAEMGQTYHWSTFTYGIFGRKIASSPFGTELFRRSRLDRQRNLFSRVEAPNIRTTYVPAKSLYMVDRGSVPQETTRWRKPLSTEEASKHLMTYVPEHVSVPEQPA